MENHQKELAYEKARKRVKKIKSFYRSLINALFTIALVGGINYYVDQWAHPWFLWVVFGFGISLFFQALKVYDFSIFSKDWETRKIKEYMNQEKHRDGR